MTADDFRAWYEGRGLTQKGFGRWLAVGERTTRRWADEGPPRSVAVLLQLMDRFGVATDEV